jgi:hypothetical protein
MVMVSTKRHEVDTKDGHMNQQFGGQHFVPLYIQPVFQRPLKKQGRLVKKVRTCLAVRLPGEDW